ELLHQWKVQAEQIAPLQEAMSTDSVLLAARERPAIEDDNIQASLAAWSRNDVDQAVHFAKRARFSLNPRVRLQAILDLVCFLGNNARESRSLAALCEEGAILALELGYKGTSAVLKAYRLTFVLRDYLFSRLRAQAYIDTKRVAPFASLSEAEEEKWKDKL